MCVLPGLLEEKLNASPPPPNMSPELDDESPKLNEESPKTSDDDELDEPKMSLLDEEEPPKMSLALELAEEEEVGWTNDSEYEKKGTTQNLNRINTFCL